VEGLKIGQVKQGVEKTRITQIDLGRFDLAFTEVFIPRLKL
jgi:hypothetical protein